MIYRLLFIFFLFPSFISVSHSSDDPWLIIEKEAKATKSLNYKGVFRSQHNKEIKGGAKYTSRRDGWYPICIIDGFSTMVEAMQCEWAVKHSKTLRGPSGRVQHLSNLLKKDKWKSKSPIIKDQNLTIYIDNEYRENISAETKELYWKLT